VYKEARTIVDPSEGPSLEEAAKLNRLSGPITKSRWTKFAGIFGLPFSAALLTACTAQANARPAIVSSTPIPESKIQLTPATQETKVLAMKLPSFGKNTREQIPQNTLTDLGKQLNSKVVEMIHFGVLDEQGKDNVLFNVIRTEDTKLYARYDLPDNKPPKVAPLVSYLTKQDGKYVIEFRSSGLLLMGLKTDIDSTGSFDFSKVKGFKRIYIGNPALDKKEVFETNQSTAVPSAIEQVFAGFQVQKAFAEGNTDFLPPEGAKEDVKDNRWQYQKDYGISSLTIDQTGEKADLKDFNPVYVNGKIAWVIDTRDNKCYLYNIANYKITALTPGAERATPTPTPKATETSTATATKQPTSTVAPPTATKEPTPVPQSPTEVAPKSTPVPQETSRPAPTETSKPVETILWPRVIGNIKTDFLEIYNMSPSLGVNSSDWPEMVKFAKEFAPIGQPVEGFRVYIYSYNQVSQIPNFGNIGRAPWSFISLGPDGITSYGINSKNVFEFAMTLPPVQPNYTGLGREGAVTILNNRLDQFMVEVFLKESLGNLNDYPELSSFWKRTLKNYSPQTNLKLYFADPTKVSKAEFTPHDMDILAGINNPRRTS
jgi:hypothetical protein